MLQFIRNGQITGIDEIIIESKVLLLKVYNFLSIVESSIFLAILYFSYLNRLALILCFVKKKSATLLKDIVLSSYCSSFILLEK